MFGVRPLAVKVVVVDVPASVEPRKIRYPVTPTLSVDAVQDSETVVEVVAVTARVVGAVGGVVSTTGASVVTVTALLAAETFIAASTARTVYVWVDDGASPVAVNVVVALVPTASRHRRCDSRSLPRYPSKPSRSE